MRTAMMTPFITVLPAGGMASPSCHQIRAVTFPTHHLGDASAIIHPKMTTTEAGAAAAAAAVAGTLAFQADSPAAEEAD